MPHLASSYSGMVTSPHAIASEAGLDVLRSGGNAIEAAIAISSCLNVTYPHFCGFAGDLLLLISAHDSTVIGISGIGQAPSAFHAPPKPFQTRGAQSILTSAAAVDALGKAFEISRRYFGGKMEWARLLEPAYRLAQNGFQITPSQNFWLTFRSNEMHALSGVKEMYSNQGLPFPERTTLKLPDLARTIRHIADNGYRSFYEGSLANDIAKGLRFKGSPLTLDDLRATKARIERPISQSYRNGELFTLAPPTQGLTTLQIMAILERFELNRINSESSDYYHLVIEAIKRGFLDRDLHIADPDFATVDISALLSREHINQWAIDIDLQKALPWPYDYKNGDTAFIGAIDEHGIAISMLSTIYYDWGSGEIIGDTGLLWHNRGASFSFDKNHPNFIAAGKRPFHTLNPGLYLSNSKVRHIYGTQGADGQPQTLATLLTRVIDYGLDPLEALSRPRFLLGKTFSDPLNTLKIESSVGEAILSELKDRGHSIAILPEMSPIVGHAGLISRDQNGLILGAHDPRSDGIALGL